MDCVSHARFLETMLPSWQATQLGLSKPQTMAIFTALLRVPGIISHGLPFWVPGVVRQRSEVVMWNLMIFRWICRGGGVLPILFLHHLRAASLIRFKRNPIWLLMWVCPCAQFLHSCPTLCGPMDCSPPGSSVPGVLRARIREWVSISFSRGSSQCRDWTCVSSTFCISGRFFTAEQPGNPLVT